MRKLTTLLAAMLLLGAVPALANDWAYWRGPEQDGICREKGLVDDWDPETGKNVLWKSDIGGRATPIVLDGRVYLNCRTYHDVNDPEEKVHAREQVVCWEAETGEVLWRDQFNVFQTDIPSPRVGWASMVGDEETGNVYMHSVSGIFRCYTPEGKVVWEHSLFEKYGKISGYGGRTQTPIIDENRIIVSYLATNWGDMKGPAPKHYYYAFDKKDGRLLWISAPGGKPYDTNYSAPIIRVIEGVRMLIGGNSDGGIHAINARTGQYLWSFRMSKRGLNASPVVAGKYVYISHGEDNIDAVTFGRIQCIDATGRGDVTDTHGVWRIDNIKAGYTGLLVKDGILYVVTDTGKLYAFDAEKGDELWQHTLGTVGKGSPVWADGKIYVMEVNGNIHILEPSREGCKTLSHVELDAKDGVGTDEIYASPAIANGRIYFVTRDRTFCVGKKDHEVKSAPIPPLDEEKPPQDEIALVQIYPYEATLWSGDSVDYTVHAFDKNGRELKLKLETEIQPGDAFAGAKVDGQKVTFHATDKAQAGTLTVKVGDHTATARARVFPPLPWKWDFEGYTGKQVPPAWIRAFIKLQPEQIGDTTALVNRPGKGRPSNFWWIGPPEMSGYTVQSDVYVKEARRRMPSIGITVNRYNLIIKGNLQKITIQSWQPHLRMAQEKSFRWDPEKWYTMKLKVDIDQEEKSAVVRGKVWERGTEEPAEWTIEATDPHANLNGSPGLYTYVLADAYFDNVIVKKED